MNSYDDIDFNDSRLNRARTPITEFEIESAKTKNGGITKETLRKWGVPWPPISGWRRAIIRHGIPLMDLSGDTKKKQKAANKKAIEILAGISTSKPQKPIKAKKSFVPKEAIKEFYASWGWRTLRMETLKKYGAKCQCCGATPGHVAADGTAVRIVVDHIKPLSRHWHLRLEPENLQVLCDECNQGKGNWDQTDHRPRNCA